MTSIRPAYLRTALALALTRSLGCRRCGKKDTPPLSLPTPAAQSGRSCGQAVERCHGGNARRRLSQAAPTHSSSEYGALSCSHCAAFSSEGFPKLRDDYAGSGRVSYELRFFMLNPSTFPRYCWRPAAARRTR
jgi:hypothetical protein